MTLDRLRGTATQPLVAFLAVASLSATALTWLGWLLLRQDGALELQRQQERLDQALDRAAGALHLAIGELQAVVTAQPRDLLPAGVLEVAFRGDEVLVRPKGAVAYVPSVRPAVHLDAFIDGERAEFADKNLERAARIYQRLADSSVTPIRAAALARLARVQRKRQDTSAALQTYAVLASEDAFVDGLPAALVAGVGRASIFDDSNQDAALRSEALGLASALDRGIWPVTRSQYEFYRAKAAAWLESGNPAEETTLARSEAVEWLWQNRPSADGTHRQSITVPHGSAFVLSRGRPSELEALIVGPDYFAQRCATAAGSAFQCGFSDAQGRIVHGANPPKLEAVRMASAANGLPWTLHVFASETPAPPVSPRRRLLITAFAIVGLVLAIGWYSIARAMSRESRVARLQADFVAAVSHEFRSPLTSLSHIAEMLAGDRFASETAKRESYQVLVRDTDRLRRLVENLLDFGRFEADGTAFQFERFDIVSLVRTVVDDFRENAASAGYAIDLRAPEDPIYASVDREGLARALWNLLDNAVKYSPENRTVWVEVGREDTRVTIAVRDQGFGIPSGEQQDIFNRFVRGAESKARRIKGTGIGLAMVRQIVRAHGGDIRVESKPGAGSRFTLVLEAEGATA